MLLSIICQADKRRDKMYELIFGDVFSEECDMIILPCNNLGGVTSTIRHQLDVNNVSYIQDAISPGKVKFIETSKCKKAKIIALAASTNVSTMGSNIKYIEDIYKEIKEFSEKNNINTINTVLLGTGLGGLSPLEVFDVLKRYFECETINLRVYITSKTIYNTLLTTLDVDNKNNKVEIMYNNSQFETMLDFLTNGKTHKYNYDVTLSFAGEDREYVEKIAVYLKNRGIKVFYDKFETANLFGKDLYQYLSKVYKDSARFCIIFVSQNYKNKTWTKHELKNAQNRAFHENNEYILPIYLEDDVELDGLNDTVGFLKKSEYTYDEICDIIIEKISMA